jgi:transcriptional regulator with XRE-family HTH domain
MEKSVFTPQYQAFLRLLREARIEKGLTQAQLADLLGETQSWVSKWERGEHRLDIIELWRICKALDVPWSEFAIKLEQALG